MLLDSDNADDEEINSEGEAFVEEKWSEFTKQVKHPFVHTL